MKQVMVLKEKYGTRILDASTPAKLHKSALSVVKARFGTVHRASSKVIDDEYHRCLAKKNGKLAVEILVSRSNFEYEGFSIENVLDVYPE